MLIGRTVAVVCIVAFLLSGAFASGETSIARSSVGVDPGGNGSTIYLKAGSFVPGPGIMSVSKGGVYLVQFSGPIRTAWTAWFSTIGDVLGYIPNDAFIVRVQSDDADRQLRDSGIVRWVGEFKDEYRVSQAFRSSTTDRISLLTFPGADNNRIIGLINDYGARFESSTWLLGGYKISVSGASRALIDALSHDPDVSWIEPFHSGASRNDIAQWLIQSGKTDLRPVWDHGIHGEGQMLGIADAGTDTAHDAFKDSGRPVQVVQPSNPKPPDLQHRKVVNYWDFGSMSSGHGTSTVSITSGDDTPNGGNGQYNGMAPKDKVSIQGWNSIPNDITEFFKAAYGDGAKVHSDSWGNDNGRYDAWSIEVDQFTWNNTDFLITIAIANRGPSKNTISSPESAKDCVAVGAGAKDTTGDVDDYSARGPAEDGRLRPLIIAPSHEVAASAGSTNQYGNAGSGTSFATPSTAGGIILIRQYFQDGFYPSGKKNPGDGFNASASLMKAVLLNGAVEMNGTGSHDNPYNGMPYPNVDQGWGFINLDNALFFEGDARKLFVADEKAGINTGDSKEYQVYVESQAEPLEVTLVYSDYPGQPSASRNLVNDLDLEVTSPSGTSYKGNVFVKSGSPHQSETGGGFDTLNNEEGVLRYSPEPGLWNIKVTGRDVPKGPQHFSLAATGAFAPPSGVNIAAPKGGEMLKGGDDYTVSWSSVGKIVKVDLAYTTDNGATWTDISKGQNPNGTFKWSVPKVDSKQAMVRAIGTDQDSKTHESKTQLFFIDSTPPTSQVKPLPKVILNATFDLGLTSSDAISGVKEVEVLYRYAGGSYQSGGKTNLTKLKFTAPKDGKYEFYSVAKDNVSWVEVAPASPDAWTIVDTVPPSVTATTPANGSKDVALETEVSIKFSEEMQKSVTESAVSSSGGSMADKRWDALNTTYTFNLSGLAQGVEYTISISSSAKDLASRPLAPYWFKFKTVVDSVPPEVVSVTPQDAAKDVPVDSKVAATFSEEMSKASAQSAFSITPVVKGSFSWSGAVMTFTPTENMTNGTKYTLSITTVAKDLAGNALTTPFSSTFTTHSPPKPPGPGGLGSGGLLGLGMIVDLLLLIIIVVIIISVVALVASKRKRRKDVPDWATDGMYPPPEAMVPPQYAPQPQDYQYQYPPQPQQPPPQPPQYAYPPQPPPQRPPGY